MSLIFPKELQELIFDYLKTSFYPNTRRANRLDKAFDDGDLKFFARGASELSQRFTENRSHLQPGYLSRPELRSGYLLYFLPINFTKALGVFSQLPASFWKKAEWDLLDLGSGPATASLAFLYCLGKQNPKALLRIHLVDQNKAILKDGENLLLSAQRIFFPQGQVQILTTANDFGKGIPQGKFDFIVMHHVLNELVKSSAQDRSEVMHNKILPHLKSSGVLAILEPALKRPNRELMAMRDHLLEEGHYKIIAPCLHEQACPMLKTTRNDWCHFYIDWQEPPFMKRLDQLLEHDNRFLKVAYLLLSPQKKTKAPSAEDAKTFRVVSNRMNRNGKLEVLVCGAPGKIRLARLETERSSANRDLERVRRGDLLKLPGLTDLAYNPNRLLRVHRNTPVQQLNDISPNPLLAQQTTAEQQSPNQARHRGHQKKQPQLTQSFTSHKKRRP